MLKANRLLNFVAILPVSLLIGTASAQGLADNAPSKIVDWKPAPGDMTRIACLRMSFSIRHLFNDGTDPTNQLKIENKRLAEIFRTYKCSCVFTVRADGSVPDLWMLNQSGSSSIDEKAMNLVKQAAPFKNAQKEAVQYVVRFPSVGVATYSDVTPSWQGCPGL